MEELEKGRESEFFDQAYTTGSRKAVGRIYAITRNRLQSYERLIYGDVTGKRVLEYGCGTGSHSLAIARRGGRVTGIDISEVGISKARERAAAEGVSGAEYLVMDAEQMTFPDDTFDLVIGEGILHHLNLEASYAEIARVLKPTGQAVFMEPLGHNPAINAFRKATPSMRTPDEHPLVRRDLRLADRYFADLHFEHHHLFSFGALPFVRTPLFRPVVNALDAVDRAAFKVLPPLRMASWYVVMVMGQPRAGVRYQPS